ncbi:hypothetical protein Q7P37_011591 [Cladosporium fusiforme]
MASYWDAFRQCFFIPKPTLTEKNLPNQAGRVFIVTGGYAGVGKELCNILYQHNGTVYLAGRSQGKADSAIEEIKKNHPSSDGRLEYLHVDLADLTTIKKSAEDFMRREQRLDVLTNKPRAPNRHQRARPLALHRAAHPLLAKTASNSPAGSVRVTWAGSLATQFSPRNGIAWTDSTATTPKTHGDRRTDYAQSKACNALLAQEYAARHGTPNGIASSAWNPGNLASELQRHSTGVEKFFIAFLLHPAVFGAYTELWAGWSEAAGKPENQGKYVVPWGRFGVLRNDLVAGKDQAKLWEWCERESKPYM